VHLSSALAGGHRLAPPSRVHVRR